MMITVGICDDTDAFRKVISIWMDLTPDLELVGEASDGRGAIDLVERCRPDVLLLDVSMPVMDGLDALPRVLRASPATAVIMLTGFATPTTRERAMALGAASYVEKGTPFEDIADAIRTHGGVAR